MLICEHAHIIAHKLQWTRHFRRIYLYWIYSILHYLPTSFHACMDTRTIIFHLFCWIFLQFMIWHHSVESWVWRTYVLLYLDVIDHRSKGLTFKYCRNFFFLPILRFTKIRFVCVSKHTLRQLLAIPTRMQIKSPEEVTMLKKTKDHLHVK